MEAGVFDWLKTRLQGLLDRVNAMAADGSLQRWAEAVADRLIRAFEATERFLFGFYEINEITLTAERVPGLFERIGNAIDRVAAVMKPLTDRFGPFERSEERRVGKGGVSACRSRGWTY